MRFAALLRGINVGGKRKLPMAALAGYFESAGAKEVSTYIQSGNVLFSCEATRLEGVIQAVEAAIEQSHGFQVPIVCRSQAELEAALTACPYAGRPEWEAMTHVLFLRDLPQAYHLENLDPLRSHPDEFAVVGRDVYLWLPVGAADTKLTNAYFDSKLKTVSTGRNWRTTVTLADLARG